MFLISEGRPRGRLGAVNDRSGVYNATCREEVEIPVTPRLNQAEQV